MFNRRSMLNLLASCVFIPVSAAIAKNPHHKNGQSLLGAKLKQNGRHQIDKAGQATVSADVNNGKVTAMSANHPQKKTGRDGTQAYPRRGERGACAARASRGLLCLVF